MNEFALIQKYFHQSRQSSTVTHGVGDDCAVLVVPAEKQLVVSIDTLVEGVHFLAGSPSSLIAERAVHVAVSDIAAMGALPQWATLALTLPTSNELWLSEFSVGLFRALDHYQMHLVGGDTTQGALTISIQVHGFVDTHQAILRSGAKVGDAIYVTGTLGDGAAALSLLHGKIKTNTEHENYLMSRFYQPEAQVVAGQSISAFASSAIDISDGLLADLTHICNASKVAAEVDERLLPYSDAVLAVSSLNERQVWALSGGDDYQLCFTVPPENIDHVNTMIASCKIMATRIGSIIPYSAQSETIISASTKAGFNRPITGYAHF